MKTKIFIFAVMAYAIVNLATTVACANKSSAQSANNNTPLVLNLTDSLYAIYWDRPKVSIQWTDTVSGGYWDETYNDTIKAIQIGEFLVSHLPAGVGASFGGSYWDGFTIGTNGDSNPYGKCCPSGNCDSSYSEGWVDHQWGVMAGGGLDLSYVTKKGDPYLIAYWGYHMEPEYYSALHDTTSSDNIPPTPMHCLTVALEDSSLFAPQEVYICNHPWPYYGNICGDGFARPLNQAKDSFTLIIHGIKANGNEVTRAVDLARNIIPGQPPFQESIWKQISISSFGADIKSIYFTMETTDSDPKWGPNTAVYFNIDKLKVIKQGPAPANPVAQKTRTATTAKAAEAIEVTDNFPIPSVSGGDVTVYDKQGKVALQTTVKAGEKIKLSKLPKGEYRLRHGHKHIPFKKTK